MWQLSSEINKVGRRRWQKSATVTEKEGDHCPRPCVPMHCAPNSVDPACVINKNSAESCWLHDQCCVVGSNQFAKFLLPGFTQRQVRVRGRPDGLSSNNIQFRGIQNDDVVGDTISTVGLAVCDRHYFYTIPCVINVQTDRLTAVSISVYHEQQKRTSAQNIAVNALASTLCRRWYVIGPHRATAIDQIQTLFDYCNAIYPGRRVADVQFIKLTERSATIWSHNGPQTLYDFWRIHPRTWNTMADRCDPIVEPEKGPGAECC